MRPPETCPVCGADVPPNARACPACGADENTGWSEETDVNKLDLPDEEFNYNDFVQREFGKEGPVPRGLHWFWWLVAVLLLIAFLVFWIAR